MLRDMTLEAISIQHAASGAKASILPGLGFNCFQWQATVDGELRELLWFDPNLLSGTTKPTRSGIPLLFPFSGRITGSAVTFEGKTYDVSDHLDDFGNPIHGFVLKRAWRVVGKSDDRVTGEFQASVDDPSLVAKWPADFRVRVTYQISADTLRSEFEVYNPDTKLLPFGLGTHGYFRVPLGKAGDAKECVLTIPARYNWGLSDKLVPTTELKVTPLSEGLNHGMKLEDKNLDNLLTDLTFENQICTTSVADPTTKRRLTVRFGNEFANCVVFVPPHHEAVCIEPYTTAPDPFRLQTMGVDAHLQLLAPGSIWKSWIEMRIAAD
jgi:aldose 1-epimerase